MARSARRGCSAALVVCALIAPAPPGSAQGSAVPPAAPTTPAQPPADPAQPAQPTADPAQPAPAPVGAPVKPLTEHRAVPDYDGRPQPLTAGEVLLWVPRIALSPLYLVSEFVLRRPLGWLISTAEEQHVAEKLVDIFTFGDDAQFAVVPTAYFDLGFRPRFGIYGRWSDMGVAGNKFKLNATVSTFDQFKIAVGDSYSPAGSRLHLRLSNTYARADDLRFYGAASRDATLPLSGTKYGYAHERNDARVGLHLDLWRTSHVTATVGVRDVDFDAAIARGTPLADPANGFATPPGYDDGYTALRSQLSAALDTRRARPYPGDGVRVEGEVLHGFDLDDADDAPRWLTYGGSLGGYLDVSGLNHVLALVTHLQLTEVLQGAIPFTELVDIGGSGPLRGFVPGRLYGDSAAAVVLEYRYPVWIWLDGSFHTALGNVYPGRLDGMKLANLRNSFGLSLRTAGSRDHSFDFTVAFGTKPIGDGGNIDAFRLLIGGNSAF